MLPMRKIAKQYEESHEINWKCYENNPHSQLFHDRIPKKNWYYKPRLMKYFMASWILNLQKIELRVTFQKKSVCTLCSSSSATSLHQSNHQSLCNINLNSLCVCTNVHMVYKVIK